MYLKEIYIENFKTFAGTIRIPLLNGFTAITGPNASGKSNITDAILFVLGPRSSRVLRAGKLPELIFNGGKNKKPAKECCVGLKFDNTDRLIPYDADEVELKRVVKLSTSAPDGYSSYFYINSRRATLTEFDELLAHAGISADGYNLVQQGDINRIVQMGPVERRRILEDIAGITKFDDEIARADEKRKAAEMNIAQVKLIIEEIKSRLQQLETDRTLALRYKELKERLDKAKGQYAYKLKLACETEINSLTENIEKLEMEKKALDSQRAEIKKRLTELEKELQELETKIAESTGGEANELKAKSDELKIKKARAEQTIEHAREQLKLLRNQREKIRIELEKCDKELAELQRRKNGLECSLKTKNPELEHLEAEAKGIENTFSKSDREHASVQNELITTRKAIEQKEDELAKLKIELDRANDRFQRLQEELAQLEEEKKGWDAELRDAEWNLKELEHSLRDSSKLLANAGSELEALRRRESALTREAQELEKHIKDLTRRYEILKAQSDAKKNLEHGYNAAVMAILEARDRGLLRGIHGTIAELVEMKKEHEVALNVAAGNRMSSIIVDDDECGAKAIEYIKKNCVGRATLLPLNKMQEGKPRGRALVVVNDPDCLGYAIDLIKFKDEYRAAFWFVFQDTLVMKNLDSARRVMGGVRLVTLDGELIEAAGAMTGGRLEQNLSLKHSNSSELERTGAELRAANARADKVGTELKEVQAKIRALEDKLRTVSGNESSEKLKIETFEKKKAEAKLRLNTITTALGTKSKEERELGREIERLSLAIVECENELSALKKKREELEKKEIELLPANLSKKLNTLRTAITTLTKEVAELKSELETVTSQLEMKQSYLQELKKQFAETETQLAEFTKRMENAVKETENTENELLKNRKLMAAIEGAAKELIAKRDKLFKTKLEMENDIGRLDIQMSNKDDIIQNFRLVKLPQAEQRLLELNEELKLYNVDLTEKMPSIETLKKTINECETAINGLGNVNMKALETYDEERKRFDSLNSDIERLENEKRDLNRLVADVTEKKKAGLLIVFNEINANFKRIYSELAVGGEAELVLENPEKPFEGGLIIKVRPEHSKVLRLEALSGGQKSLTALSFIFAIQHYQPSPFYVLDEVDMYLDSINSETVARKIKANSHKAQFIMISLRKCTIKEADHIIGVTRLSDGTSQVVMKVNLADVKEEGEFVESAVTEDGIANVGSGYIIT